MALTGNIFYGVRFFSGCTPTNWMGMVGEDGKYYVSARNDTISLDIGCANDSSFTGLSFAQVQTDWTALALGGGGTMTAMQVVPVPGTKYFFVTGVIRQPVPSGLYTLGWDEPCGVRYKIVNSTTFTVDGGFRYRCGLTGAVGGNGNYQDGFLGAAPDTIVGAKKYGNYCYAVASTGVFFSLTNVFRAHFIRLPLVGSPVDVTEGSWNDQIVCLRVNGTYANNDSYWYLRNPSVVRGMWDRLGVMDKGGGVFELIGYVGANEVNFATASNPVMFALSAPALLSCTVDFGAKTSTAMVDRSADFGVPYADVGKNYANVVSGIWEDDYTTPSVIGDAAPYELVWARSFTDQHKICRMRRYAQSALGVVTELGSLEWQFHNYAIAQSIESVGFMRVGDELLGVFRSTYYDTFGSNTVPLNTGSRRWMSESGPVREAS